MACTCFLPCHGWSPRWGWCRTLLYPTLCWNELRLGTGWWPPIRGSVFFEQLPRSYLAEFGQFFCKKRMPHILPWQRKKIGVQISFLPPQIGWFLSAVSLFQNWGPLLKIEGQRLWWSRWLVLLLGQHVAKAFPELRAGPQFWKPSWHPARIKRRYNRQGNNKELLFQIESQSSILEKGPPLKVTGYFGA